MRLSWPYVSNGRASLDQTSKATAATHVAWLCSRANSSAVPLTQPQLEYLANRLFDRCNLDVIIRQDGRITLVARKLKAGPQRPGGSK